MILMRSSSCLKSIGFPFTDQQLETFYDFCSFLAEEVYENDLEGYDENIYAIAERMESSKSQAKETVLDIHEVLRELDPSEFIYCMDKFFAMKMEKGMSYDKSSGRFYFI